MGAASCGNVQMLQFHLCNSCRPTFVETRRGYALGEEMLCKPQQLMTHPASPPGATSISMDCRLLPNIGESKRVLKLPHSSSWLGRLGRQSRTWIAHPHGFVACAVLRVAFRIMLYIACRTFGDPACKFARPSATQENHRLITSLYA
jgi:hypothetical protein